MERVGRRMRVPRELRTGLPLLNWPERRGVGLSWRYAVKGRRTRDSSSSRSRGLLSPPSPRSAVLCSGLAVLYCISLQVRPISPRRSREAPLTAVLDQPRSPRLPSHQMATINSLPPELLLHIIRMAGTSWQKRPCHRTLRVAALVCRSWQRPAQKVLWEDVEIDKAAVLDLFLAWTATLGLFTTRMWLSGGLAGIDGVHAAGVAEALGRFPGLQRLHLFHVADVDYSALCAPHLSGTWAALLSNWTPPDLQSRKQASSISSLASAISLLDLPSLNCLSTSLL